MRQAAADRHVALKPFRKRAKKLMEQIEAQTGELGEIEQALADPALYDNASQDRMERLFQRQGELRWSLENLEV